jgi:two-component system NtrC family sensor kinase
MEEENSTSGVDREGANSAFLHGSSVFCDYLPSLFWRSDSQGKFDFVNKVWLDFTGHSPDEELGSGWMDGIHPEDFDALFTTYKISIQEKKPFHVEFRLKNYNSEYRWVVCSGNPFYYKSGNYGGHIGICYDITERRQMEEILRVSEDYFKSFIESSQDCIAHITTDGRFLSMNEAGCRLYGISDPGDIVNMSFSDMVVQNRELVYEAIGRAAVGDSVSVRYMSRNKQGNELWWDAKLTPVIDLNKEIRGILLVSRDITEQKRAEDALEQKNRELGKAYAELKSAQSQILQQEKMASIGQLAAGVAHEINNPMGFIISNINSLNKYTVKVMDYLKTQADVIDKSANGRCDPEALNKLLEKKRSLKIDYISEDIVNLIRESLDGADRVKKIVQDLKNFSRIDETEYKMADINAGIDSTINIIWNELKYKASLVKEFGDIPPTKCNPGQLNQVFMNLLMNAVQAIEQHGEIRVKTWHEDNFIKVSIADSGCGIPEDKLGRIFEPFFTTKEVGKGTGLGLSIVYDIVKKHNGDIHVQSEIGKGTTFILSIPITEG